MKSQFMDLHEKWIYYYTPEVRDKTRFSILSSDVIRSQTNGLSKFLYRDFIFCFYKSMTLIYVFINNGIDFHPIYIYIYI
jgi:hypothetical protein